MSKQDIEKRLGFAAQGVKAEMASIPGITDLPYEANPQGTHRYKVGDQVKDKRHPSFQGTIKRLMRDKYGYPSYVVYTQGGGPQDAQDSDLVLASRPGAKIKFSAQFEVGRVYEHSFIGDYDAIVQWKVLSRTASTLTIKKVGEGNRNSATTPTRGEEKRVKINSDAQGEFVYPMGKFSMAPILRASKTTASRPGVKTSFSNGATTNAFLSKIDAATRNKILTSIAKHYGISASQAMAEVTDADAESLLDYMTEPERSATSVLLKRHGFSRAGAKAAMAKPLRKAEPYEALYYKWFNGIQVSIMDMTKIKNDINAIIASGANPDVEMPKLVKKYASSGFSRLGAKANFAADAREVGNEILRQLGGGRFMSMVGGKNAMYGMFGGKPGLQVSIGKGAEGGINRVIITLDPATDTYRMEFWKIAKGGMSTQKVSEASMVYADDLQRVFTNRTKFYTSMSRPGVKAKFATEVGRKGNKSAMISRDATGTWYAYVVQRIETGIGKDEDMLGTMRAYSTEDRAKRAAIKALDTSGFSRPGVKAKA